MADQILFERRLFNAVKKLLNNKIESDTRTLEGDLREALRIAIWSVIREDHSTREEIRKIVTETK